MLKERRIIVYKYIYKYQICSFVVLEIRLEVLYVELFMEFL